MKKFTYIIIAFLMALSCEQLEQFQEGLTFDDANTALLTQTVSATATSARSLSFKAADVWIAEVKDAAWLTVTPGYGGAGDYTLQFKLEMNTAGQPRSGKVVLTCKSKTTEVTITQEGLAEWEAPQAMAYVKTIGMRYVENVKANGLTRKLPGIKICRDG